MEPTMQHSQRVIAFINIGHVIDHMFMLIFPTAVLGMAASFHWSYSELLALSVGGFIAFGVGSVPAGWLGDLWSRRNMMAVFFLGIGAATALTGLAPSPWLLAAGLTLIGLFGSIYHPVGTAMLTAHADRLGHALGVNGVWGNLGVAFAALATGALTQWFGWRTAFVLPGLLGMLVGLAFLWLVPDRAAPPRATAKFAGTVPRAVMLRAFAVLLLVSVVGGVTFNATTVSLPKLFDERLSILAGSPLGVGMVVAAVFVIGAMAQLVVGKLVDRFPLRSAFLPLAALQAPCLLLAAWGSDWALLALAVGMMFAIFGQVTINETMVAKYTTDRWRARAYAARYFVSFGVSAFAVPLVALLHRTAGFTLVFEVLAGFGLLVFVGALLFPHRPDEIEATARQLAPAAE
jgi:MFS family permease